MQVCARDYNDKVVFAHQAIKQHDYFCIECQQQVRVRSGIHRQAHFYHLQPNRTCALHAKGMIHLMLQSFIQAALPQGEAELECRFNSIGRIADVAWHPPKLVYEIQYSPISAEEVLERNNSYASIGYQVIWIFHDNRYNKSRLSAAEEAITHHPHYFSNMNAQGEGIIYDQFSAVLNGKRMHRLPILTIDISTPQSFLHATTAYKLPFLLRTRGHRWPLFFRGDTLESWINMPSNIENATKDQQDLQKALQHLCANKQPILQFFRLENILKNYFVRPYQAFLNLMLERACK